jgi:hypothetical protein
MARQSAVRSQYGSLADSGRSLYSTGDAGYRTAASRYDDYLRDDPYTDSYSAQALARATAGTESAYQGARARLATDLARRGLSPESGAGIGGAASIENARAGMMAAAYGDLAQRKIAERERRQQELLALFEGMRGAGLGQTTGALSAMDNIDRGQASMYADFGANAMAREEARFAGLINLLGQVGELWGHEAMRPKESKPGTTEPR